MPLAALALLLNLLAALVPGAHAETTGILKVKSNVDGAEIWVDGAMLGKAPVTRYLPPGAHTLRVVADFHDPFVRRVEIVADRTVEVNASLVTGKGSIEFTGPAGGHVFLDGVDRGALPIRLPAPAVGKRTWRVEAPKHEPAEGAIDFVAGHNYLVEVVASSSAGVFVVESTPVGAKVQLDGKDVGVTPLRLTDVPLGKHGVLVALEGRAAVARAVDTSGGDRGEVKVSLPEGGTVLAVTTGRDDAKVYVDGALVGTGSAVKSVPLAKGRYKVRVDLGGTDATDTVSVPARGQLALRVAGDDLVERKPLVQRWGFWAAVGGGVAVGGATAAVIAASSQPPPPPTGDTVAAMP